MSIRHGVIEIVTWCPGVSQVVEWCGVAWCLVVGVVGAATATDKAMETSFSMRRRVTTLDAV